jgi:glycerol-3-phosphate dehydrogenase (NAD(P)+)
MSKVIVMGNGAWGSALFDLIKESKHDVLYWKEGEKLNPDSIIVGAIPTQAIRIVLEPSRNTSNITYINCAKGIERASHKLPYQIVTEILGSDLDYFTLIGPSFSEEVKDKMPTIVNLGYRSEAHANKIKNLFQTDYFRVKLTRGIRSLELAAAFKNIYAIGTGLTDGLGFGMNTRVKLMVLAMSEFEKLRRKLGYKMDDKALPATIGDLILTCNSPESRNFSFGKYLAKTTPEKALKKIKQTVEGYYTAESIPYFERETGVKLPLAHFIYEVTRSSSNKDIKKKFTDFIKTT